MAEFHFYHCIDHEEMANLHDIGIRCLLFLQYNTNKNTVCT